MKFLVDMPLSPALARWLRDQGHDALHAGELGMSQSADTEILEKAKKDRRIVVTADLDYPRLLALAQAREPGLILFRGGDYSEKECLDGMTALLGKVPAKVLNRSIAVVERTRIRLRRLAR